MPNMKSLSLTVQKLWPRLKVLPQSHRQTGQKLDTPEFHSGGIEIIQFLSFGVEIDCQTKSFFFRNTSSLIKSVL